MQCAFPVHSARPFQWLCISDAFCICIDYAILTHFDAFYDLHRCAFHMHFYALSHICSTSCSPGLVPRRRAVIYWRKDAEEGAPDAFQARISAHLATFLRIYAHLYRICSPTLLCAPRHAFFPKMQENAQLSLPACPSRLP